MHGVQDIYVTLLESLQKVCGYAIQDDYSYWSAKKESAEGGKLLLIDEADYDTHQIFFDDNISDDPAHSIVDVRDLITGETMLYKRTINKFIVRVESDKAILETDYFIKKIQECEKRRTEEIENLEKGILSQEEISQHAKVDEWALLQQLNTNEYLSKTVLPVVYQGLKEIDVQRPEDPIKELAFFLLKNQGLVKLPEKKMESVTVAEEQKKMPAAGEEKKEDASAPAAATELKKEEKKMEPGKKEDKKAEVAKKDEKKVEAKKEQKKK